MPITLQVPDALASRLQDMASAEKTALDEFTLSLLEATLDQIDASKRWRLTNERRLALIAKSTQGATTPEEDRELESLQAAADRHAEPGDRRLLEFVARMEAAAKTSPSE